MNNRDSKQHSDDDTIAEMLSRLRQLEPPLSSRVASRTAVAAELARMTQTHRQRAQPLWRRSISIPWPVAAMVLGMLVVLGFLSLRSSETTPSMPNVNNVARDDKSTSGPQASDQVESGSKTATWAFQQTATYLCGIGELDSDAKYIFEE